MNTKILAQNIVNNPSDFTAEQIEKYFEDYAELRLSAIIKSVCRCKEKQWCISCYPEKRNWLVNGK